MSPSVPQYTLWAVFTRIQHISQVNCKVYFQTYCAIFSSDAPFTNMV